MRQAAAVGTEEEGSMNNQSYTVFVIAIMKDGKQKFVNATSVIFRNPVVDKPQDAKHFTSREDRELKQWLGNINYPGLECRSRSGIESDTPPEVIQFNVQWTKVG
jgi:hypothetical protein